MNDIQDKIAVIMYKGRYNITLDEGYLLKYKILEREMGMTRALLKPQMIEMRNNGFVELSVAVDFEEYRPSGSGYGLTQKGVDFVLDKHPDINDDEYEY